MLECQESAPRLLHICLTLLAVGCASVSVGALLLHAAGWLPMYFLIDVLGAPSLVLLLTLATMAYRVQALAFLNRLGVGIVAGFVATLGYDVIRYCAWVTGIVTFNPFVSHPIFGRLITGYQEDSHVATIVGWGYHAWNGLSLALMYTLIAGSAHWFYALGWAVFLEIAWLTTLPSVLQLKITPEFVTLGFVGHAAYGGLLGYVTRTFLRVSP